MDLVYLGSCLWNGWVCCYKVHILWYDSVMGPEDEFGRIKNTKENLSLKQGRISVPVPRTYDPSIFPNSNLYSLRSNAQSTIPWFENIGF